MVLYADPVGGEAPIRGAMARRDHDQAWLTAIYTKLRCPQCVLRIIYTPRDGSIYPDAFILLEENHTLWAH